MATVVTGLACSLSLQSAAYLQGLNAAAMATTTAAARMQGAFARTTAAANTTAVAVQRNAAAAANANRMAGASFLQTGRNVTAMANSLKGLFAATLIIQGVRNVVSYADAWQEARNKLAAAEQIAGVQGRSMAELNKIATATRSPIEDIVDLYAKLIRTASGVVKSENDIAQITKTVAEGFKAGGASTLEQVNGIRQLAQALGSGILQGDELRSIRENAPLVAKAIADELGTTVAGLKKLGAEGKITSEVVARALIKSQNDIHQAFLRTTPTVSDSFVRLNNAIGEWIDKQNQAAGASRGLARSISVLADNFEGLMSFVGDVTGFNEAVRFYENITRILQDVTDKFNVNLNTESWSSKIIAAAKNIIIGLNPVLAALKFINDQYEKWKGITPPVPVFGASAGRPNPGARSGFGGGAAPGSAAEDEKTARKALEEHRSLINDVGSAYEKYQVRLDEIKEANYSAADAQRAVAQASLDYKNNLDQEIEALGLTLTPMQEYESALRNIAAAEEAGRASAESAFAARAVAAANFAATSLQAFGALSGALTQLFKENKAIAIANAIISTAEGIANSLKLLPSPLAWVYAAAAAVTGAAQISTILSTNPGSGNKTPTVKGGGKSSGSAASSDAGKASKSSSGPAQMVTINVTGESFGPEHFRKLVNGLNAVIADGATLRVQ